MQEIRPIEWLGDRVKILDQTRLPREEVYLETDDYREVASAVVELKIRGAPAIGLGCSYAMVLGALKSAAAGKQAFLEELDGIGRYLKTTRPTAVNLFWAVDRMLGVAGGGSNVAEIRQAMVEEAVKMHREQIEADERLSEFGASLIQDGTTILTHCNAGALATGGRGTALGVIKKAWELGKNIEVLATETRPLLQGARLTAWELHRAGIPFHLITDSMAGHFMSRGKAGCVVLGADRITANGDTANKIGTYTLAVLAREHGLPFYVAAPTSTIDITLDTGMDIPIEERHPEEVTRFHGVPTAPEGIRVYNPAFDVTPHRLVTAIVTERGIIREPFVEGIKTIMNTGG